MFAFYGIDLALPESQLVTVYLRDRETYVRFLESQHAGAFRTTQGYYHPMFRAVVAYEVQRPGPNRTPRRREPLARILSVRPAPTQTARATTRPDGGF